jgi:hypothetical protein
LDNAIANLYPGFLVYEMNLGLSFDKELGTFSYLKSEIKNLMMISFDKITFTMSIDIIRKLIENKKIGNRGHKKLDVIACCLIVFFMLLSIIEFWINIEKTQFCILILITLILEFSSLFLFLWTYFCYSQKNPTDDEIKKAIQEVEEKYNTNS